MAREAELQRPRSQAGAWERAKAGAWERAKAKDSGQGISGQC